jgi:hypothetical protein
MRALLALSLTLLSQATWGVDRPDPADCLGFSAQDAAAFLGTPTVQLTRNVQKVHATLFTCSYAAGKAAPGVAFSVAIAPNAKKATEEMERYRSSLVTAGETAQWKGKLPKGAYSDIMGPGDEGVWTEITGAYTMRKGHITVQVTAPKAKLEQVKLGRMLASKL